MILANTSLVVDPVWPWSVLGSPALLLITLVLVVLTVLTYLVGQRASVQQFLAVLAIRLTALLLVFLLLLRPSLAHHEETIIPSKLILLVDSSGSMNNKDEFASKSRWEAAWRLLQSSSVKQVLKELQDDQKVEILFYQGAENVSDYKPEGKADGKRTDMGQWLRTLYERHGSDPNVRALILITDGADNGTTYPTLEEAKHWRCPLHTIGLGSPKTTAEDKDIYFVPESIVVSPSPVPVKGKLTIKAVVNAPGFAPVRRPLRLFLNDEEVDFKDRDKDKNITLSTREDNKIEIVTDAPAEPGDYKVTLKIDPHPAEVTDLNNEIGTYVTVTKDVINVLWVEGKKRLESTWAIRHALSREPKVQVFYTERAKQKEKAPEGQKDWFQFEKQYYDVVVIGDISASRFAGDDPEVFSQLEKLVKKGSGLLLLGGYESFGNSDWHDPKLEIFTSMLPVELDQPGQVEGSSSVRVEPTDSGLAHYLMKLADDPKVNKQIWSTHFKPLDGMTRIGTVKDKAVVLATDGGEDGKPVMAFHHYGGRVLVFGGDTTWKAWRQNEQAVAAYEHFWKRLIYWLAQKDKVGEDVWVKLSTRRLPAGGNHKIGITVGLNPDKSKKYGKVSYKARVIGPGQKDYAVSTWPKTDSDQFEQAGYFWETNEAGEYKVLVDAYDDEGQKINEITTESHFLTYAYDLENLRPAADHAFLSRLASAGGGQFRPANETEVADLLAQLAQKTALSNQRQSLVWPDWNREPITNSVTDQAASLITSGILFIFLAFSGLLCLEWLLRRRWNMV